MKTFYFSLEVKIFFHIWRFPSSPSWDWELKLCFNRKLNFSSNWAFVQALLYLLSICILLRNLNIYILLKDYNDSGTKYNKISGLSGRLWLRRNSRANKIIIEEKIKSKYLTDWLTFRLQTINFNKVCQSDWLFSRKSCLTIKKYSNKEKSCC